MLELGGLLQELEGGPATADPLPQTPEQVTDDQLAKRRLGIASSLFAALQCKHAATAAHSMRVALTTSAWAARSNMDDRAREHLEIAALLHDVGIIGVPEQILLKPSRLDSDEALLVSRARAMSLEIVRRSCTSPEILEIVQHVPAWYDGSVGGLKLVGEQIPLSARMIAIAEAYDAMTTERVFRPACSQELAVAELFRCAGTQFDPQLVRQFVDLQSGDPIDLHRQVATRWLLSLDPKTVNYYWDMNVMSASTPPRPASSQFESKLLDNMYDAVVFVDERGRITQWNHGAERMTGIAGATMRQQLWNPDLIKMSDEKGQLVAASDCPLMAAIKTGVQSLRRMTICGRNDRKVAVDCHSIPVIGPDSNTLGAILQLHDASSEISLESRCQTMAQKATRDPLTQVANRAEFDRVRAMFVNANQQQQVPCALLMCDLDRFKQVNDNYGHQAGDEAIKSLAALLKGACHPGDFVARYGGEEFVMLCADCNIASAFRRADEIRKALTSVPQPRMNGRTITVSFGVTEIQSGDTSETMLRRADRALLMAKEKGRNQVIQLGSGSGVKTRRWAPTPKVEEKPDPSQGIRETLITPVPTKIAIEKLRGFVADHKAEIREIDGNRVLLDIEEPLTNQLRRSTDRPIPFQLEVKFEEQRVLRESESSRDSLRTASGGILRTRVHVIIAPSSNRDRRRADLSEQAQQVLASLRSYLMAMPEDQDGTPHDAKRVKSTQGILNWLRNR